MTRRTLLAACAVAAALAFHGGLHASPGEIVVIVNKANPTQKLNREELRPLFQTTKNQWPDGSRVAPYNLPEGEAHRVAFDTAVLGLDPERVSRYWVDRKIRGGERPPGKVTTPAAVLRAVSASAGAVGYVDVSDATNAVKIIARIRDDRVLPP